MPSALLKVCYRKHFLGLALCISLQKRTVVVPGYSNIIEQPTKNMAL